MATDYGFFKKRDIAVIDGTQYRVLDVLDNTDHPENSVVFCIETENPRIRIRRFSLAEFREMNNRSEIAFSSSDEPYTVPEGLDDEDLQLMERRNTVIREALEQIDLNYDAFEHRRGKEVIDYICEKLVVSDSSARFLLNRFLKSGMNPNSLLDMRQGWNTKEKAATVVNGRMNKDGTHSKVTLNEETLNNFEMAFRYFKDNCGAGINLSDAYNYLLDIYYTDEVTLKRLPDDECPSYRRFRSYVEKNLDGISVRDFTRMERDRFKALPEEERKKRTLPGTEDPGLNGEETDSAFDEEDAERSTGQSGRASVFMKEAVTVSAKEKDSSEGSAAKKEYRNLFRDGRTAEAVTSAAIEAETYTGENGNRRTDRKENKEEFMFIGVPASAASAPVRGSFFEEISIKESKTETPKTADITIVEENASNNPVTSEDRKSWTSSEDHSGPGINHGAKQEMAGKDAVFTEIKKETAAESIQPSAQKNAPKDVHEEIRKLFGTDRHREYSALDEWKEALERQARGNTAEPFTEMPQSSDFFKETVVNEEDTPVKNNSSRISESGQDDFYDGTGISAVREKAEPVWFEELYSSTNAGDTEKPEPEQKPPHNYTEPRYILELDETEPENDVSPERRSRKEKLQEKQQKRQNTEEKEQEFKRIRNILILIAILVVVIIVILMFLVKKGTVKQTLAGKSVQTESVSEQTGGKKEEKSVTEENQKKEQNKKTEDKSSGTESTDPTETQKSIEITSAKEKDPKSLESGPAKTTAAETKAAETKAAETKAAETKAAETKAAETKAAETEAAETKAAETKAIKNGTGAVNTSGGSSANTVSAKPAENTGGSKGQKGSQSAAPSAVSAQRKNLSGDSNHGQYFRVTGDDVNVRDAADRNKVIGSLESDLVIEETGDYPDQEYVRFVWKGKDAIVSRKYLEAL